MDIYFSTLNRLSRHLCVISSGALLVTMAGCDSSPDPTPPNPPSITTCFDAEDCPSGFCVDKICCDSACDQTCMSCEVDGKWGTCLPVPFNEEDDYATITCEGSTGRCDGQGMCIRPNGQSCAASSCESGFCKDGFCCESACNQTCMSCGVQGKEGTCAPVPLYEEDPNASVACNAPTSYCDGNGSCKLDNGQACVSNAECISDFCMNGTCTVAPIHTGPIGTKLYVDDSPIPEFWSRAAKCEYPTVELDKLVARADGSVVGAGKYKRGTFGLTRALDDFGPVQETYRTGPHPFKFEVAADGTLTSLATIALNTEGRSWMGLNCQCWVSHYTWSWGPLLWIAGGDLGYYFTTTSYKGDPNQPPPSISCTGGEFIKFAAPQWSLTQDQLCPLGVINAAGNDAGSVLMHSEGGLTRYEPSGQIVQAMPYPFGASGKTLFLGPNDDIYAGGRSEQEIWFAKADAVATMQWSKSVPLAIPAEKSAAFSHSIDSLGNVFVSFDATDVVDLGLGPLAKLGANDIVVAKFDPLGNPIWAKRFGGPEFKLIDTSMVTTGVDDMALMLKFTGNVDLGDGVLKSSALQTSPVLAKFDASGNLVWHADLSMHFPFPATAQSVQWAPESIDWVVAGHPSGAVFVAGTGNARDPKNFACYGMLEIPRPVRFVVAQYGP
jgi:hypothetical protein